mmetsp:Transcript_48631/g.135887  ORF Transcript_48631/g.135887 Transcript_48631/m.135887 type:complete len:857 (+) Transcript_48631:662-3232(+)
MLLYLRRSLPWEGLKQREGDEKYERIMDTKMETPLDVLCKGEPSEFAAYVKYCRGLGYEEEPNYAHLVKLWKDLLFQKTSLRECNGIFDWTVSGGDAGPRRSDVEPQQGQAELAQRKAAPAPHVEVKDDERRKCTEALRRIEMHEVKQLQLKIEAEKEHLAALQREAKRRQNLAGVFAVQEPRLATAGSAIVVSQPLLSTASARPTPTQTSPQAPAHESSIKDSGEPDQKAVAAADAETDRKGGSSRCAPSQPPLASEPGRRSVHRRSRSRQASDAEASPACERSCQSERAVDEDLRSPARSPSPGGQPVHQRRQRACAANSGLVREAPRRSRQDSDDDARPVERSSSPNAFRRKASARQACDRRASPVREVSPRLGRGLGEAPRLPERANHSAGVRPSHRKRRGLRAWDSSSSPVRDQSPRSGDDMDEDLRALERLRQQRNARRACDAKASPVRERSLQPERGLFEIRRSPAGATRSSGGLPTRQTRGALPASDTTAELRKRSRRSEGEISRDLRPLERSRSAGIVRQRRGAAQACDAEASPVRERRCRSALRSEDDAQPLARRSRSACAMRRRCGARQACDAVARPVTARPRRCRRDVGEVRGFPERTSRSASAQRRRCGALRLCGTKASPSRERSRLSERVSDEDPPSSEAGGAFAGALRRRLSARQAGDAKAPRFEREPVEDPRPLGRSRSAGAVRRRRGARKACDAETSPLGEGPRWSERGVGEDCEFPEGRSFSAGPRPVLRRRRVRRARVVEASPAQEETRLSEPDIGGDPATAPRRRRRKRRVLDIDGPGDGEAGLADAALKRHGDVLSGEERRGCKPERRSTFYAATANGVGRRARNGRARVSPDDL